MPLIKIKIIKFRGEQQRVMFMQEKNVIFPSVEARPGNQGRIRTVFFLEMTMCGKCGIALSSQDIESGKAPVFLQ